LGVSKSECVKLDFVKDIPHPMNATLRDNSRISSNNLAQTSMNAINNQGKTLVELPATSDDLALSDEFNRGRYSITSHDIAQTATMHK